MPCTKSLDALGGTGTKTGPDIWGNPLYHKYLCVIDNKGQVTCGGQTYEKGKEVKILGIEIPYGYGKPSQDEFKEKRCEQVNQKTCTDDCVKSAINDERRPFYGLVGPGTNCQEWANQTIQKCINKCSQKK